MSQYHRQYVPERSIASRQHSPPERPTSRRGSNTPDTSTRQSRDIASLRHVGAGMLATNESELQKATHVAVFSGGE
eukprot:3232209-Rhodomonas_salina.1